MSARSCLIKSSLGALALAAAIAGGCAADVPVSRVDAPSLAPGDLTAEQIENLYRRRARPVRNVTIEATLWDPNLIAMANVTNTAATDDARVSKTASSTRAAWSARYVEGQTSFFVVLELANRPPTGEEGQDPLVNPRNWGFRLTRGDDAPSSPTKIEVISQDRFPTQRGGYHWRLVYAVHFEGTTYDAAVNAATGDGIELSLRVLPEADMGRKSPFGRRLTRQGFVLKWWATPGES